MHVCKIFIMKFRIQLNKLSSYYKFNYYFVMNTIKLLCFKYYTHCNS